MKRSLTLLVAVLILTAITFAQDKPIKVKGVFKKCEVYRYEYKFGQIDLKSKTLNHIEHFNEFGYLIEKIGNENNNGKTTYKYNISGNLYERTNYNDDNTIMFQTKYKYDNMNNLLEIINYEGNGTIMSKVVFVNDIKGNKIKETEIVSNNPPNLTDFYK